MRDQFSIAFDAYLQILRTIENRVQVLLGRDGENWRIKNSCPCCCFKVRHIYDRMNCFILTFFSKLEDEKNLIFTRMFAIDGNNSAKRFMNAALQDDRTFKSDYFLTREEVDIFKDEVKSRPAPPDDEEDEDEDEQVRSPTAIQHFLLI